MDTLEITLSPLLVTEQQTYHVRAYIVQVNGLPDEYAPNDTVETAFEKLSGTPFRLEWKTDNAPLETSWTLKDENGTIVTVGNYTEPDSLFVRDLCLRPSCYTFTVTDNGGNGLCCGNGNGYFQLTDPEGNLIAFRGAFGTTENISFCFPEFPADADVFRIYPVPSDGSFNLMVDPPIIGETLELRISDMSGRIVVAQPFTASYVNSFSFPFLAVGIYHASVYSNYKKKLQVQKILVTR
jgi:hypothetical protein